MTTRNKAMSIGHSMSGDRVADPRIERLRPRFTIEPMVEGRMVVALPPGHRLAKRFSIRAGDLEQESIIGLEPASRLGYVVRQAFERAGTSYTATIEVRHCVTACSLVEQGLGVAVVDEFSAAAGGSSLAPSIPTFPSPPARGTCGTSRCRSSRRTSWPSLAGLNGRRGHPSRDPGSERRIAPWKGCLPPSNRVPSRVNLRDERSVTR